MTSTIAFLGLGAMGTPMAANLAAAGFQLRAWNRTPAPERVPGGAVLAASPRDAALGADFAVTMLSDDAAVESVTLGPEGLLSGLSPAGIHIGMSTVSPALSSRLATAHASRGSSYLAAPVFGRPDAARSKLLWILAGGADRDVERSRPLFDVLGQGVFHMGGPADASLAKLAGNFLLAATIEALGEAFTLVEKGGLDPSRLHEMLVGTLFGSPVVKNYGNRIAQGQFVPPGFSLILGRKDMLLALGAAQELAVPLPLADLILGRVQQALDRGREGYDFAGFTSVIREEAGLPPPSR
jgi:3-hydroxyisobutyrate dehydrogenase-like beta-hydroxyacid dehydrogenase